MGSMVGAGMERRDMDTDMDITISMGGDDLGTTVPKQLCEAVNYYDACQFW